jgi:hypothetical protein
MDLSPTYPRRRLPSEADGLSAWSPRDARLELQELLGSSQGPGRGALQSRQWSNSGNKSSLLSDLAPGAARLSGSRPKRKPPQVEVLSEYESTFKLESQRAALPQGAPIGGVIAVSPALQHPRRHSPGKEAAAAAPASPTPEELALRFFEELPRKADRARNPPPQEAQPGLLVNRIGHGGGQSDVRAGRGRRPTLAEEQEALLARPQRGAGRPARAAPPPPPRAPAAAPPAWSGLFGDPVLPPGEQMAPIQPRGASAGSDPSPAAAREGSAPPGLGAASPPAPGSPVSDPSPSRAFSPGRSAGPPRDRRAAPGRSLLPPAARVWARPGAPAPADAGESEGAWSHFGDNDKDDDGDDGHGDSEGAGECGAAIPWGATRLSLDGASPRAEQLMAAEPAAAARAEAQAPGAGGAGVLSVQRAALAAPSPLSPSSIGDPWSHSVEAAESGGGAPLGDWAPELALLAREIPFLQVMSLPPPPGAPHAGVAARARGEDADARRGLGRCAPRRSELRTKT